MRQRDRRAARIVDDDTREMATDGGQKCHASLLMDRAEPARVGFEEHTFAVWTGGRDPAWRDVYPDRAQRRYEMLLDRDVPPRPAALAGVRAGVGRVNAQAANGTFGEYQNVNSITKLIGTGRRFRAMPGNSVQGRRLADCSSR
jgi:hypothetical protein